ncbi:MAG: Mutlidrug resistance protein [Rhizobium sp.]|nr:Mutlidrug resistance protein [Rhizobium sp.]
MLMSSTKPSSQGDRFRPSTGMITLYGVIAAALFSASSSAPTPVYHLYQESLGLSHLMLTVIFASYAISLLVSLLTVGGLSDYVGRKPMILAALLLNAAAMIIFILAGSATELVIARVIQGFATGAAMTTMGAAILDNDKGRAPILNSVTAFIGLTFGSLVSGAFVAWLPMPTHLIYVLLFAISAILLLLLPLIPESTAGKPGALRAIVPQVRVPRAARKTLARITPVNIAGWALGGFYFSLMPSLVRAATGLTSPFVGGLVVALLTLTATFVVLILRNRPGAQVLSIGTISLIAGVAVTLGGVWLHFSPVLIAGAMITGIGFGGCFSGAMRTIVPLAAPDERAGLLAAFFVQSYLAFSLPAVLVGLAAPVLGLSYSAYIYGAAVMALATISLIAARLPEKALSEA